MVKMEVVCRFPWVVGGGIAKLVGGFEWLGGQACDGASRFSGEICFTDLELR